MSGAMPGANPLRGEFTATLAGESHAFDTTLGSVARIEEGCGGRSVLDVINAVVVGRRASDQMALLASALQATGRPAAEAAALARRATLPEAEAFVVAFLDALGFKLAPKEGAGAPSPLDGPRDGASGDPSRSAA